jgi:ribosomal protein S18 acetylase RimI-like enzyme
MSRADKPALMRILRDTPEFKDFEVDVAEEVIDSYLDDAKGSGYHILIAEADSVLAGYIVYGETPCTIGTWDIYWEAIARDKRGQGIGRALMVKAEADIEKSRGRLIFIETSSQPLYEPTRRYYLRCGYETISTIDDFYAPGDAKLIMQKRLG